MSTKKQTKKQDDAGVPVEQVDLNDSESDDDGGASDSDDVGSRDARGNAIARFTNATEVAETYNCPSVLAIIKAETNDQMGIKQEACPKETELENNTVANIDEETTNVLKNRRKIQCRKKR